MFASVVAQIGSRRDPAWESTWALPYIAVQFGWIAGYAGGVFSAGIFLVAELFRKGPSVLRQAERHEEESDVSHALPASEPSESELPAPLYQEVFANVKHHATELAMAASTASPYSESESPWYDDPAEQIESIYSVTRRFDISTMLVAMAGFALLFAGLRLLGASVLFSGFAAGLLLAVAASQAFLFGGKDPRRASFFGGWAYCILASIAMGMLRPTGGSSYYVDSFDVACIIMSAFLFGGFIGYLAGTLAAGVFLVADVLRGGAGDIEDRVVDSQLQQAESPWDEDEL